MYANPVLLPAISNRESMSLLLTVFDDDTGQPLNLSGTTGVGTFMGWNVTTPNSNSVFAGSLTIATGVLSITLNTGLNIAVGDSISLVQQSNNTLTMFGTVVSYISATGALTAQIGMTVQFEARLAGNTTAFAFSSGYVPWWDYGSVSNTPALIASVGNGITFPDIGQMVVYFPESQIKTLQHGTYNVGVTIKSSDGLDVRQVMIGRLPVFNGYVTT